MSMGEEYMEDFNGWFGRKHHDAKRRFCEQNPEPAGWEGFYARRGVTYA
jgi:hypothetical protein